MHPLQVAAQYAAFVWFTGNKAERQPSREEALRFAKDHWTDFIASAHEGLGRLLLHIAEAEVPRQHADRDRPQERKGASRADLAVVG